MTDQPTAALLREALRGVLDPATGRDIVASGMLEGLEVRDGLVQATLAVDRSRAAEMEGVRRAAQALLAGQCGVRNATVVLTAHKASSAQLAARPAASTGHAHPPSAAGAPAQRQSLLLPDVGSIIAIASGKGGVGKSTVAVNLAVALARQGLRIGLLDADVYGPSLPRMLGLDRRPSTKGDKMIPLTAFGISAMSIGFLVDQDTAMIWRGPMVMSALEQMMREVAWGPLDVLVVDMPPGTGDAQLTMAQRVALAGAVIVSTPQDVALADARRGVRMFEKTRVPVLGLIENMSYFCCPNCGHRAEIFGHGGARAEATRLGVDFLGEVPLLLDVRASGDAGTPIVASAPDSAAAQAFAQIATRVREKLGTESASAKAGPRIVVT
jgi:ATP-binding protein involved in chromosome partitioning